MSELTKTVGRSLPAREGHAVSTPYLYPDSQLLLAAKDAAREWRLHGQLTDSCRKLESAITRFEDEDDKPLGLDEWVTATRRMLHEVYPANVFTGVSGDPGPRAIVVIRSALAAVDAILGEVRE